MKAVVIVIASALAAVACTNPGEPAPQGRASNSGNTATSPGSADDRKATTTPLDQGSSASETSITASIRRGIMADETLSAVAESVKVITVGSKVTLRGPVKDDQAKVAIANIARRTAGVIEVDNQLEVSN
jgi:osmotically-inducible protein OsmY